MSNGQSHSSFVPWKLALAASSWYLMMTTTSLLTLTTVVSTTSSWYLAIVAPNVVDIVSISVEEIRTPPGDGGGIPDGWDVQLNAGRTTAVEVLRKDLAAVVTEKVIAAWILLLLNSDREGGDQPSFITLYAQVYNRDFSPYI